jgi:ribonuclease HI
VKKVTIVTDGACSGNPGPGGWAALLKFGAHEKLISGGEENSTNNRMEITAVLEALRLLKEPCEVEILVDSRYVMDAFQKGWITNWKSNGWRTADKKAVKNQDLWVTLDALVSKHKVRWTWVKGHNGHIDNERVDEAARLEASKFRNQEL